MLSSRATWFTTPSVEVKTSCARTKSAAVVAYSFCEQISSFAMLPFIVVCRVPKCTQTAPCEGKR